MKNRLSDLNNHLFQQLERLNDESLNGEKLQEEISRSKAISAIARDIVGNGKLVFDVQKSIWDRDVDREKVPAMLTDK